MDLWAAFRQFFEEDDGSLPGLGLGGLSGTQVASAYTLLRSLGGALNPGVAPATFWDKSRSESVPLDAVPNAAVLVCDGQAEPFHFVISQVRYEGVLIPDLGVFVFPDSVVMDYRMGAGWNPKSVRAFLRLLRSLMDHATGSALEFDAAFGDPRPFLMAWDAFLRSDSHS